MREYNDPLSPARVFDICVLPMYTVYSLTFGNDWKTSEHFTLKYVNIH